MARNQDLISYTNRSYASILSDMVDAIPLLTDKWLNYAENDPGIVLLKLVAATADMLSYNTDFQARENFPQLATMRVNAQRSYDLINYKMKWYESATIELTLKYNPPPGAPAYVTLPAYTQVFSKDDLIFTIMDTKANRTLYSGVETKVKAVQGLLNNINSINLNSIKDDGIIYLAFEEVDYKNIVIRSFRDSDDTEISNYEWTLVDDLNTVLENGRFFEFRVDLMGNPYIKLCSNFAEYMNGNHLTVYYLRSDGANGNVAANTIDRIGDYVLDNEGNDLVEYIEIISSTAGINGADPETLSQSLVNAQRYSGLLDSAVVLSDYEIYASDLDLVRACRALEINIKDPNVEHYKNFTYFPRIKNGVIVAGPEGEEYPVEISYRKLYVDDLSELCYRLSRSSADSETLTYERVDLLLQLVTRDFTNPSTNIQAELDAYLLDKKVFCVNQKYTTGYTQIIPYNVVVYHTEPYSLNLNKSLSEEITKALTKYYDEDRQFGEFLQYRDITNYIESVDVYIDFVDIQYPRSNVQVDFWKYPRLGPVCVALSDNPNLPSVQNVLDDTINAIKVNGTVINLSNRNIILNNLFNEIVARNQGGNTTHFYSDGTKPAYDETHYLDVCGVGVTPDNITLLNHISLYMDSNNRIIVNEHNGIITEESELSNFAGEYKHMDFLINWYSSRTDIVHVEPKINESNVITWQGVVENTQFAEDSDVELWPLIGMGDCYLSMGERLKLVKRGIYN